MGVKWDAERILSLVLDSSFRVMRLLCCSSSCKAVCECAQNGERSESFLWFSVLHFGKCDLFAVLLPARRHASKRHTHSKEAGRGLTSSRLVSSCPMGRSYLKSASRVLEPFFVSSCPVGRSCQKSASRVLEPFFRAFLGITVQAHQKIVGQAVVKFQVYGRDI